MQGMAHMIVVTLMTLMTVSNVMSSCCTQLGETLICRSCNLTSESLNITDDTITELVLSDENVLRIPNEAIFATKSLKRLILAESPLLNLDVDAFKEMTSVEYLESRISNFLSPLPVGVFCALKDLRHLSLLYIYPTYMVNNSMDILPNLEYLAMRMAPHAILGNEFLSMTKLKYLHILGIRSSLVNFTNRTFASIPHLETLHIAGGLENIEPDALLSLPKLSTLALPCNKRLSIRQVTNAIKNQKKAILKKLILDWCTGDGGYSLTTDLFNSTNFNKLTHLSMRRTYMLGIDPDIICYVLPDLRYISVGWNNPTGYTTDSGIAWDLNSDLLYKLLRCVNYRQIKTFDIGHLYNFIGPHFESEYCRQHSLTEQFFHKPPTTITTSNEELNRTVTKLNGTTDQVTMMNIPPSLEYVYLDHVNFLQYSASGAKARYCNDDNNIAFINVSHSQLAYIALVKGLNKLQGFDASHTQLNDVHPDLLFHLPSLKYLNLAHNNLENINLTKFLAGGSTLHWLDLSNNGFREIPPSCLSNLSSIENISFRSNPLVSFNINLESNTKLRTMDLSSCLLQGLEKDMIHQLNNLQSKVNHTLHIDISNNTFQCCNSVDMIRWFSTTKVNIRNKPEITCTFQNQTMHIMDADAHKLEQMCSKHGMSVVLTTVPVIITAFLIVITVIMVFQFKWQLRWYAYRLRWHMHHLCSSPNEELLLEPLHHQHNAFVSYNHTTDYEWVGDVLMPKVEDEWGLRLCIAQRDFELGKPIAENICEAIDECYRTILIITPGFVESDWCEFEMQMALTRGQQKLVIIYKEEVPTSQMSKTLLYLLKSRNYIEYNKDPEGLQMFWQRLHECLIS